MEMKRKFGLFTAVCMIVGVVIGSGIFFKSDNVLVNTNGNVFLGILVFVFAAIAIIFGSLSMAELATRTDKVGGVIAYAEENISKRAACVFGWYQSFIYCPTILAIVSWVVGIYSCILFGIEASLEIQIVIGLVACLLLHILNYISVRLAGYFQNGATIIKLIPIVLIAVLGFYFGEPNFTVLQQSTNIGSSSWITAIGPIAFAYDGWSVSTSVSHEIKNTKRNLPLALIIAPIFILIAYVSYFIGICALVGPEQIMQLGDEHVYVAIKELFGGMGSKILLVFIVISVMGTANGLILGSSRGLYALGTNGIIPYAKSFATLDNRFETPTKATIVSYMLACIWLLIHYVTTKYQLLGNSDVSEISIVTMYLFYAILYLQVIRLKRRGEIKSILRGYVIPGLAIAGSVIIFFGGIQSPMFWVYIGFSIIVILISYLYAKKNICD